MDVLRRYMVMVLGLGSACVACALLCGVLGVRATHVAAAAEPLAAVVADEPAAEVPSEPDAASNRGSIETILPGGGGKGPLAIPGLVAASLTAARSAPSDHVQAALIATIAPDRPRSVAAGKSSLQPPAPPGMRAKTVRMRVTAYCPCAICCGRATGITASGLRVSANGGKFAATGDEGLLPMGSMVSLPGYNGGRPVPVIDRMADEDEPRLDIYFRSHQVALEWGVKWMDVTVYVPVKAGHR
jgi:3D (Asp-Asp-Asp) domain-containing protein